MQGWLGSGTGMNVLEKIKHLACAGNRFPNLSAQSLFSLRHSDCCVQGEAYDNLN
jgi:hypothetical protein